MLSGGSISLLAGALMRMAHRLLLCAGLLAVAATTLYLAAQEAQRARLQARVLSELARGLHFTVESGRSEAIRFPGPGPYDQRRGYTQLPAFIERLTDRGYDVTAQARMSPRMLAFDQHGLFPTYRERNQAGLVLLDCRGEPLYAERFPQRVYERFDAVPPLLVDALLFIENRELLEPGSPRRNPAVEWDRLANAVLGRARRTFDPGHPAPGGSTLATQIEKYRHSPEGRTDSLSDKLRQMASASLRAYLDGEDTLARRRQIVVDYLDTVPLSAQAGSGEVNGLGDAMWAWYGRDFDEANRLLSDAGREALWLPASLQRRTGLILGSATLQQQAVAFKQALSLLVAQRRPSHYLVAGQADLAALTDSHLRLLAEAGVISAALRDAALPVRLRLLPHAPMEISPFAWRKASATTRSRLSALLDVPRAYDLDRLDLTVVSSVDGQAQRDTTRRLRALKDRAAAKAAGLYGFHLLNEGDDPGKLMFSVSLYERGERTNLLRVQTDSGDQPFDINEGARLDMGSTAKLRTLVSYLELVTELHERWSALDGDALAAVAVHPQDALGRWARGYLARAQDRSLAAMLEAAMERRFSASPAETFRTGGGLHHFVNFDHADDSRMLSVREALKHSVNLVFIRLMRDVVQRHIHAEANAAGVTQPGLGETARREQLARFADAEGQVFITRFFRAYREHPDRLWRSDGAQLARTHPLQQWLLGYLRSRPQATLAEALAASQQQRQQAYGWLFKTRHASAQDLRIRSLQEGAAFAQIHRTWQRLGYPFDSLTPSYATAIGASGDRPAALAELMGIIANDGLRLPAPRMVSMVFAHSTPYETHFEYRATALQRVLPAELTRIVRRALVDVVEEGTARRLTRAFVGRDGQPIALGGKTGTGDHRFDVYGKGGLLISSRAVDRTASFVFLLGARHFGTVMIHAHEPDAARYRFTSALAAQVLKSLSPALLPLVEPGACTGASAPSPAP
jgi:membrane peptidoglycan carboxypeptidase